MINGIIYKLTRLDPNKSAATDSKVIVTLTAGMDN
jgi:hypothetical protein